jgi:hypothetical protein
MTQCGQATASGESPDIPMFDVSFLVKELGGGIEDDNVAEALRLGDQPGVCVAVPGLKPVRSSSR